MATVLERFNELGLKHDKKVRSFAGERCIQTYREECPGGSPELKEQSEDGFTFKVWDYPRFWQERMDYVIILACAEFYKKSNSNG